MTRTLILALALVASAGATDAASPQFRSTKPNGAQRGTAVEVTLRGSELADAREVLLYEPGLAVTKFEVVNPTTVKVTLQVAADCRLGEHPLRIRTESGVSDLRTFWVGTYPVVAEKEPNTEFDKAQVIPLNTTVEGVVQNEDADYFTVECKKGQRLSVEIEGMRLGTGFWDPFVAILDAKRFELAVSDDAPTLGQDAGCSVIVPADGKYTVLVRESSYGGGGRAQYRLHVGTFPRPTAVIPAGGRPGEEVEFRFIGDPSGEIKQKIKLPAAADDHYRLRCTTADGTTPSGFAVRVSDLPSVVESGANTSAAAATTGTAPGAFNGVVSKAGETKYFKFAAKKGQVFVLTCHARSLGSPLDPVLHVLRVANGQYLTGNDDSRGPDSVIRFTAPEDGEYAAYVHDHLKKGGPDYFFRIEVTAPAAATTTGIPKVNGNNSSVQDRQTVAVPRGGRYATLVNVTRSEWGGPAVVSFDKLPAGVTVTADPVDPGQAVVPVVFEAKPDAPLAATLTPVRAAPADPKVVAPSALNLDVHFNMGINNTAFHRVHTDRLAVAVTEVAPYAVEVVVPKAPVPQNGSINLKVLLKRAEGFKGPVTIYPLFTPPGTGIAGQTTFAEGQTEALVAMNAAPNASPRSWKTAFIASAASPKGGVLWTSSQLFPVEICAPFVTFAQERTAVEQGAATKVFGKLTVNTPFDGKATAKLVGLPAKATTPDQELTKASTELGFPLATEKDTPAGKHKTFVQVTIPVNGEQVSQNVGGGEVRVDVPLPPKVAAAKPAAAPTKAAAPKPAAPVAAKPLSRLEQLRKEQAEREKAGEAPAAPPAKK